MNIDTYKTCIDIKTINTGLLSVIYDFTSGREEFVYNKLFSTGEQIINGIFNSEKNPGVVVQTLDYNLSRVINSGIFSGRDIVRIGYDNSLSNFTVVIDFNNSFCNLTGNNQSSVILSTMQSPTGLSGFSLGMNQANHLYLEYINTGGIKTSYSFSTLLREKNTVALSVFNDNLANVGIFDYSKNVLKNINVPLVNYKKSDTWYIGGFYNNADKRYTGLFGEIENFVLFNDTVEITGQERCIECLFCSGYENVVFSGDNIAVPIVTGYLFDTVNISGVTGYSYVQQQVPHPTGGYSTVWIYSGVTGVSSVEERVSLLTGSNTFTAPSVTGINFYFDYVTKESYSNIFLSFYNELREGDLLEIYTYRRPVNNLNIKVPQDFSAYTSGYKRVNVFDNGLYNISGLDYNLISNKLSGYDDDEFLFYDRLNENVLITNYSGLWSRSKILINSGTQIEDGGPLYFPSGAQYIESGLNIIITGISGINLTGYDLFLNGQKLIQDYDYETGISGSYPYVMIYAEELPDFTADVTYLPNGNVNTITNIQYSLLSFLERITGESRRRYVRYLGAGESVPNIYITGFSEQIWINGVRQFEKTNYIKTTPCSLISDFSSFTEANYLFFNNNDSFFNIN
jgi:hypothetical protein